MNEGERVENTPVTGGVVSRALNLKREGIFGLLLVLTALLGWVVALGAGGAVILQHAWHDWSLNRAQTVTVYLPADSAPVAVNTLAATLATEPGITHVEQVPDGTLRELLAPYGNAQNVASVVSGAAALPLPVVLDVTTDPGFDRQVLSQRVQAAFATAEVDDARELLQRAGRGVRVAQSAGLALALVMVLTMLGLVALTVRVGLRSQRGTLALLRQLGASDRKLMRLVAAQVAERVLPGWFFAAVAGAGSLLLALRFFPEVQPLVGPAVWLTLALAPGVLALAATLCSAFIARRQLHKMV